jgi:hypothetical protein
MFLVSFQRCIFFYKIWHVGNRVWQPWSNQFRTTFKYKDLNRIAYQYLIGRCFSKHCLTCFSLKSFQKMHFLSKICNMRLKKVWLSLFETIQDYIYVKIPVEQWFSTSLILRHTYFVKKFGGTPKCYKRTKMMKKLHLLSNTVLDIIQFVGTLGWIWRHTSASRHTGWETLLKRMVFQWKFFQHFRVFFLHKSFRSFFFFFRAQFHQHSTRSFCANSLVPVKYKPKT